MTCLHLSRLVAAFLLLCLNKHKAELKTSMGSLSKLVLEVQTHTISKDDSGLKKTECILQLEETSVESSKKSSGAHLLIPFSISSNNFCEVPAAAVLSAKLGR